MKIADFKRINLNYMKNLVIKAVLVMLLVSNIAYSQDFIILPNGHSHNDYTREVPLFDALKYGFTSIEVDVYWDGERMVVTHDNMKLDEKPTIEELYLDPLKEIVRKNGGTIYRDDKSKLVLMVDLKSDKVETYWALKNIFSNYLGMMEWYKDGKLVEGPIQVLLTGGPPVDLIEKEEDRYFYVDGSVGQWSMNYPANLMPRASTNFRNYFKWRGDGQMPAEEETQLRDMINKAHDAGRKIRFWASPDNSEVWKKLLDEGVDWINVDDLEGFNSFYRSWKKTD
jgi:hypothetical protein